MERLKIATYAAALSLGAAILHAWAMPVQVGGLKFGVSLGVSGGVLGARVALGQGMEPGSGGGQMGAMSGHGGFAAGVAIMYTTALLMSV